MGSTAQYSTVQYSTVQYSTVQYSTERAALQYHVRGCNTSAARQGSLSWHWRGILLPALPLPQVASIAAADGPAPRNVLLTLPPALQFNINDGGGFGDSPMRRSHERLIRKLMSYKNHPAVVEFIFYMWPGSNNNAGWVALAS